MEHLVIDRPLFLICDRSRRGVAASDGYCDLIGRDRGGVIGTRFDEWVDPAQLDAHHENFARAIQGENRRYVRRVRRRDGSAVTIAVTASRIELGGGPHVLGNVNALFATDDLQTDLREHQAEVARYIETLAGGLAGIVKAAGLGAMSDNLKGVAEEAARLARDLAARHGIRRT